MIAPDFDSDGGHWSPAYPLATASGWVIGVVAGLVFGGMFVVLAAGVAISIAAKDGIRRLRGGRHG